MNDLIEKTENVINKLCKAVEIEDEKYIRMDDKYSNLIPIIISELKKYLNKRKDSMKRYKDYEGVRQKLKTYSKKTGLKYRNMGCQESNNYCKLTRRMKKKRMSWSKNGSENIAKVITTYASESCTDIIRHLKVQILPESFTEYAERYIAEIEENIKEMKKEKVKTKKIYTFKQGSLEGYPQLKKILENKAISELIYR